MQEKYSQFEAATRQLDMAIKLFFEGVDLLSVCTLAGAADRIFEDIYKHERSKHLQKQLVRNKDNPNFRLKFSMHEEFQILLKEEYHKEFFSKHYRKKQNVLKHADNNYGEELEFDFDGVELEVFRAAMNYLVVCDSVTMPILLFVLWFFVRHPDCLKQSESKDDSTFRSALKYVDDYYEQYGKDRTLLHCYDTLKLSSPHMFTKACLSAFDTIDSEEVLFLKDIKRF